MGGNLNARPKDDGAAIVMPIPGDASPPPAHPTLGGPDNVWIYRDEEGASLGGICRWDKPTAGDPHKKEIRPLTLWRSIGGNLDWRWESWPEQRPLYGLDRLAKNAEAPVLVTEGEKAADAAGKLFANHVCITSPGGALAAGKADWSPLKGRSVVIWPDNDDPGNRYAVHAGELAGKAGASSVRIVSVQNTSLPASWDLADDLPAGIGPDELRGMLDLAQPGPAPESPMPLRRALPDAPTFPAHALGPLREAAEAIQDMTQAPLAIGAQSVMAVASLAVQAHVDVLLPTGSQKPASCFFVTVAASGERKSACDERAMRSVEAFTDKLRSKTADEEKAFRNAFDIFEGEREQLLKKLKSDSLTPFAKAGVEADLNALVAPPPPLEPRIKCGEPTIEGLFRQLKDGLGFAGLMSAEGGAFIGGFGMSADHRLKTSAHLSSLWDGASIERTRASEGFAVLKGRRLAVHLMMQPNVAAQILADDDLIGQGLIGRLLVAAPTPTAGSRKWREPRQESQTNLEHFHDRITEILEWPRLHADKRPAELTPRPLPLSDDARMIWIDYHDKTEVDLGTGKPLAPISSFAAKLPEHAARLAGVLAAYANIDAVGIDADAMMNGIALAEFYKAEALRLFEAGTTDPDLALAEKVLSFISERGGTVSLRCVYTHGPNAARDKATAERVMRILEDHRQVEPVTGATIDGRTVRKAWRLAR